MEIPNTVFAVVILVVSLLVLFLLVAMFILMGVKIQLVEQKKIILMMLFCYLTGLSVVVLGFIFGNSNINRIFGLAFSLEAYTNRTWMYVLLIGFGVSFITIFISKLVTFHGLKLEQLRELKESPKGEKLLFLKDLKVYYPIYAGFLKRIKGYVKAVNGVTFEIKTGETLGLVGESGCGKSTIAKHILGLVPREDGTVIFENVEVPKIYPNSLRKKVQIVFQDPDASLNPRMKIVDTIAEPLRNLFGITDSDTLREKVMELLNKVSLKREHLDRFPHEFSGGQKQRIIIARALACNPKLIILDEPTSALDVSVQAQILNLLKDLQSDYGYAFLFITHNLSVVHHIADKVAVMYLGKLVEYGPTECVFEKTLHPYTKALLSARAEIDPEHRIESITLKGEVPSPINPPSGCAFHPRCYAPEKADRCQERDPEMFDYDDEHKVWCHFYKDLL